MDALSRAVRFGTSRKENYRGKNLVFTVLSIYIKCIYWKIFRKHLRVQRRQNVYAFPGGPAIGDLSLMRPETFVRSKKARAPTALRCPRPCPPFVAWATKGGSSAWRRRVEGNGQRRAQEKRRVAVSLVVCLAGPVRGVPYRTPAGWLTPPGRRPVGHTSNRSRQAHNERRCNPSFFLRPSLPVPFHPSSPGAASALRRPGDEGGRARATKGGQGRGQRRAVGARAFLERTNVSDLIGNRLPIAGPPGNAYTFWRRRTRRCILKFF